MKNMMLQVKKHANIAFFLGVLVALCVSCKNGQNDPDAPAEYGPIEGNLPTPEWTAVADYDMTSSMVAIVKVENLNNRVMYDQIATDKEALLAAFAGEECLGVAQPDSVTGYFFLYICSPSKEDTIRLKYYSAMYKNIFVDKNEFLFGNDALKGTLKDPYLPSFWAVKR